MSLQVTIYGQDALIVANAANRGVEVYSRRAPGENTNWRRVDLTAGRTEVERMPSNVRLQADARDLVQDVIGVTLSRDCRRIDLRFTVEDMAEGRPNLSELQRSVLQIIARALTLA